MKCDQVWLSPGFLVLVSLHSLPGLCHPSLSLKFLKNNPQHVSSAEVQIPQRTRSGTTWLPLLHSKTTPLFSSLPASVRGRHHYPKSRKLWAAWSVLCSLTVSARWSLILHLKSVFSTSSPVLVSVQILFISNLSYNNRLLFDLPDFRLTPTFFPPYCYWSDLLNFKSDHVISQTSSLSDFQMLRRQD